MSFLLVLKIIDILTYEFKCPEESHRKLRVEAFCDKHSPKKYSCLLNELENTFEEMCNDTVDFVRPGMFYLNYS